MELHTFIEFYEDDGVPVGTVAAHPVHEPSLFLLNAFQFVLDIIYGGPEAKRWCQGMVVYPGSSLPKLVGVFMCLPDISSTDRAMLRELNILRP